MRCFLESFFKLSENGTTFGREVLAGIITFMAMSYILAVQPSLMKDAGMPIEAVATSTALIAGISTILMGVISRYPFALAPGMGENLIFAYVLILGAGFTWQQGISVVLISGLVFLFLTLFGLREKIAQMLPAPLKLGIGGVVGIFLIYLGMTGSGIAVVSEHGFALGKLTQPQTILSIVGFFAMLLLIIRRIPGAVLIGMAMVTIIGVMMGYVQKPDSLFSFPPSVAPVFFEFDFSKVFTFSALPFILIFLIGDFFGTMGTLLGVAGQGGYLDKNGNLPNINKPFAVDASSTVLGSMFGLSTVTTYVESASGIAAGGRTGLTSVVTGLCFFLALFCTPMILMIPSSATSPVLLLVGFMLLDSLRHINFGKLDETIPPLSMLVFTIFSLNMTTGIAIGVLLYIAIKLIKGEFKDVHWGLCLLGLVFIYYIANQIQ